MFKGKLDIIDKSPTERLTKAPSKKTCLDKRTDVKKGKGKKDEKDCHHGCRLWQGSPALASPVDVSSHPALVPALDHHVVAL